WILLLTARRHRIREDLEKTRQVRNQIKQLDHRLSLFNARVLLAPQHGQTAVLKTMETCICCLARGYDPCGAPQQVKETRIILGSTFDEQLNTLPRDSQLAQISSSCLIYSGSEASVIHAHN
ncbi:hypothetical protein L914_02179, partial [Phytophthora nicotianae]